ncbi:hypothetical protein AB0469_40600 [Streptomyces sp. NPDC093801]|uniref:hypothetical protein n=1 Tax=Streptomyces sp. NPDC093801 TaxID=3155203 RepID=UPI00344D5241
MRSPQTWTVRVVMVPGRPGRDGRGNASSPHGSSDEGSGGLRQQLKDIHSEFIKRVVPRLCGKWPAMTVAQCQDASQAAYENSCATERYRRRRA